MPQSLAEWILYFFLYSFIGWLMETVLCSVRERRFINRGFLNGPLCPIYGWRRPAYSLLSSAGEGRYFQSICGPAGGICLPEPDWPRRLSSSPPG